MYSYEDSEFAEDDRDAQARGEVQSGADGVLSE